MGKAKWLVVAGVACVVLAAVCVVAAGCSGRRGDIHAAAAKGDVALVRSLLERNPALLEQPDERGRTPLHAAAAAGQKAVVQLLLTKGANVNAKDKENTEPLLYSGGNLPPDRQAEALTAAGELRGAQERAVHVWGCETPLSCAARNGHSDVVALLIAKGADVNTKDAWHRTPLYHAAAAGATEVVRLLLSKGANVNAKDAMDEMPLHVAAIEGRLDTARLLLSSGANVNAHGDISDTPLHMAAWAGHTDLARLLLSKGARVNAKTGVAQETPLHYAAATGQTEVARILLSAGGNVNAKSKWGDTPLYVAASEGQVEVVRLLITKGASVNAKNENGNTPLHAAARAGYAEVVQLLRAGRANANARNRFGATPSREADDYGHKEIADVLSHSSSAPRWMLDWADREKQREGIKRIAVKSGRLVEVHLKMGALYGPMRGPEMEALASSLWLAKPPQYDPKGPFEVRVFVAREHVGTAKAWRQRTEWRPVVVRLRDGTRITL